MLLENKVAVVYGATGTVGGTVARAFARAGARVVVTGRSEEPLQQLVAELRADGGEHESALVDALDPIAVDRHLDEVLGRHRRLDVSFNAVGYPQQGVQGTPLTELSPDAYMGPVEAYARTNFVTATAAARRMAPQSSGTILTLTAIPARGAFGLVGGMAPAWSTIEALTRSLAAEVGAHGVRVVGIRSHAIPETPLIAEVNELIAPAAGVSPGELAAGMAEQAPMRRLPTLAELGALATFLASDGAGAMTGTMANMSAGATLD